MHLPQPRAACAIFLFLGAAAIAAPVSLPPSTRADLPESLACSGERSVARMWNEQLLAAIRIDAPRPTVHARNLFHVSAAIYDAFAAYDPLALPVYADESPAAAGRPAGDQPVAISYAAYRMLLNRFAGSPGQSTSFARFDACMGELGLDTSNTTTSGSSPAAVGNRIAAAIIARGLQDGSNQQGSYVDPVPFFPTNAPMLVQLPGTGGLVDINAWQPLIPPGAPGVQTFLTSHWRQVEPFAIQRPAPGQPYVSLAPPPRLGGAGDAQLRADIVEVIRASSLLTPANTALLNHSPRVRGNHPVGTNDGSGHAVNPVTGQPYADNFVLLGDYARVVSEFWADGPRSSTPPGHWNEIANAVSDHPALARRFRGSGPVLARLDWDVKLYLALNAALHDVAIATWETKFLGNASRPITLIREMASLGQSSDPALPAYHANGLPLVPGLIELVTAESSAPGQRHAHLAASVGRIAILAWAGHPPQPASQAGGVAWILGDRWIPYQARAFVTPPFPGYTSGHSGFSRGAAEVLADFTGSAFFPGGLASFRAATDGSGFPLGFEFGPSQPMDLQYATYFDAADEAGISRIYGGIHPAYDDFPGRLLGQQVGRRAMARAAGLFGAPPPRAVPALGPGAMRLLVLLLGLLGVAVIAAHRR
ncbi:MAG: vanadium-dependent haloperoxidase [Rhodanobacteraceae bacterium]|nr:vanadium-dependent haloperoxidase [Rhodanobacteraceae bacterium]